MSTTVFEIGPFRLDPDAGVLTRDGKPMALGPRGVAVLTMLVEHATEHVAKARIIDAAWPGLVVEEHNLAVQVNAIRRILADAPGGNHWIETLPRRGYRFVGPVAKLRSDRSNTSSSPRSNLPAALTSFVGRERELVEFKRLLSRTRLVTITGVAGIGKTRLALEAASEVLDAYQDGVWIAELASIRDPLLVAGAAAYALGVPERSGKSPTELLAAHLKSRQLLLLLDNCEHLIEACAQLVETLLGEARNLSILTTSREPLRLVGEQIYALHPLSLPQPGSDVGATQASEAVQLLVERLQFQVPGFHLTAERAPAVADICIHLDGIPLAIELAAARARSLSIEQIGARLSDRFRLLASGSRTAPPRQQTLRATLDWSYDLLAEDERVVLRRLSIFPGSFIAEAASAVASDTTIDEFAVVDIQSQLVARSLVIADPGAGQMRYRLLETIRAYGLEKLGEAETMAAIQRRHAEYFCAFFKPAHDGWLCGPEQRWRDLYPQELDNLRAALDWAFAPHGDPAIGITLAAASAPVWQEISLHSEARTRLDQALACMGSDAAATDQARLFLWRGMMMSTMTPAEAVRGLERAVDLYRSLDDALGLGHALARLAGELAIMGQPERSKPLLEEAFRLTEPRGVPKVSARCHYYSGMVEAMAGDLAAARTQYEKALSLFRAAEAERQVIRMLTYIAEMDWAAGDLVSAIAGFREAIALLRVQPRRAVASTLGVTLANLSGALIEHGEPVEAMVMAREGMPLLKDGGYAWLYFDHLALRAALAGNFVTAAKLTAHADLAFAAKQSPRQQIASRAYARARVLLAQKLAPDELARLLAEGGKMSDEDACRLALED